VIFDEISANSENLCFFLSDEKNNQLAEYGYERPTRRNDEPISGQ